MQWAKTLRDLVELRNSTLANIKAHMLGRDETGVITESLARRRGCTIAHEAKDTNGKSCDCSSVASATSLLGRSSCCWQVLHSLWGPVAGPCRGLRDMWFEAIASDFPTSLRDFEQV